VLPNLLLWQPFQYVHLTTTTALFTSEWFGTSGAWPLPQPRPCRPSSHKCATLRIAKEESISQQPAAWHRMLVIGLNTVRGGKDATKAYYFPQNTTIHPKIDFSISFDRVVLWCLSKGAAMPRELSPARHPAPHASASAVPEGVNGKLMCRVAPAAVESMARPPPRKAIRSLSVFGPSCMVVKSVRSK
jgi:hypothetical protein